MDIKQAKEALRRTYLVYTERDEFGSLRIPAEQQRPLLLMGPPGVGKTAILSQLAEELGAGLVAYTMTHHTRQSAIGLPLIREKTYGGKPCSATEYTMSEILASIYDQMEQTGQKTGFFVPRRDQLRLRNAGSRDAAIIAEEGIWKIPCPGGVGDRGGGQPAGI